MCRATIFDSELARRRRGNFYCELQISRASYDVPAGAVFSSQDYLFSSGTRGTYCSKLNSTNEQGYSVEFIAQHPILVVSLVKIVILLFLTLRRWPTLLVRTQGRWHIQCAGPVLRRRTRIAAAFADGIKFLSKRCDAAGRG